MSRNEKELSFSASDVNFRHLCCLFIESTKSWRCSLDEKRTKIVISLYIVGIYFSN